MNALLYNVVSDTIFTMKDGLIAKKEKAVNLRLKGRSYSEIVEALGLISKGTLSYWFRDIKLSSQAEKRLRRNVVRGFERGLLRFNKERTKKIKEENAQIIEYSEMNVPTLSYETLLLVGVALYWGEGYKRQPSQRTPYISFGNTDPFMIKIFMRFVREILCIPEDKIRGKVQIHPNLESNRAINFWSKIAKIPKERLRVTYQVSRASKGKRPINIQPYGTVEIIVSSRKDFFRIMGWIKGLANQV